MSGHLNAMTLETYIIHYIVIIMVSNIRITNAFFVTLMAVKVDILLA